MILKLLIFAVVAVLIYRFFGGKMPSFTRSYEDKKLDDDTLVECSNCHTYATVKESLIVGGKY
ncbi:MAG: hypothetical protein DRQ78_10845, partial [Epsilonproteobacteria bacterium]